MEQIEANDAAVRRVLVVDDNPNIHNDFRHTLEIGAGASRELTEMEEIIFGAAPQSAAGPRFAYRINSAYQGQDAMQMVEKSIAENDRYRMAFVDMRMPPGWDGLQTIEALWKVDPQIQIVICTAYSDYSWDEIQSRLGRTDQLLILRKPFDRVEVCQMAAALCEKWRLTQVAQIKESELNRLVEFRTQQLEQIKKQDRLRMDMLESVVEHRTAELRHAAMHDKLTGLPNRSMLSDRLARTLHRCTADPSRKFSVLFLDLDDFKLVNDTLGHEAGDRLLQAVADRIMRVLRRDTTRQDDSVESDLSMAARLGGDEFVILIENMASYDEALAVGQQLLTTISSPFDLGGRSVRCGVSIGITSNAMQYQSVEQILRDADIAMYRAKSEKNRFVVFTNDMHAQVAARFSMEAELRVAVALQQFSLDYQPIVSLQTGRVAGFEALIRWNHPERGCILPDQFISLAENIGIIGQLGLWTAEQACRQLVQWREKFPTEDISISVNLSTRQLIDPMLITDLEKIIARTGADPSRLVLEVTEGYLANNEALAEELLHGLQRIGVRTYIDDFGTGHSSLGRLPMIPINGIKIDRLFMREANTRRKYAAIVNAVVSLAHHMDAIIVAEGIESADQVALLQALDCEFGQGYFFSRPLPPDQVEAFLHDKWRFQPLLNAA